MSDKKETRALGKLLGNRPTIDLEEATLKEREPAGARVGGEPSLDRPGATLVGAAATAGEYLIVAELSRGGWGAVYRVEHGELGRPAAIKVLHRELAEFPEHYNRFVLEAKTANRIGHPNIVDIYDVGQLADGRPYLLMELLHGQTLKQLLETEGAVSLERAAELITPVCQALDAAHDAGIIHRDIKPSNIFVALEAGIEAVKLLDFGIAKYLERTEHVALTATDAFIGTPSAMAPEQLQGLPLSPQTDVYALGVTLFELVTGKHPFRGKSMVELERAHLEAAPPSASEWADVPAEVDELIARCMSKDPADRFESILDVASRLSTLSKRRARPKSETVGQGSAAAIYFEVRVEPGHDEVALLGDVTALLDYVDEELESSGLVRALDSGNAVMGASLSVTPHLDASTRQALLQTAEAIWLGVAERLNRAAGLSAVMCVHAAEALIEYSGGGLKLIGGDITRLTGWPLAAGVRGFCATEAMTRDIESPPPGIQIL